VATPTTEETSVGLGEPRSRSELVLEMIALRHQIAVLKRSGTRRPCFGLWDRLFWLLLSWRLPRWPESLMIIQPETVKRWRRNGWSGL
jgi:putative transposase